jgi:hypothetical protein
MTVVVAVVGCSTSTSAQQSPAEKRLKRAAEMLLEVHIREGFLAVPPTIGDGTSTDECKDLLRAQFQLDLARRDSSLKDQKTFVEVQLLLSQAKGARLDVFALKDPAERDSQLRSALAQTAVVDAKQELSRAVNATDDLPKALAQVEIEDALCGGPGRQEAKIKFETFKNEALVGLLQSDLARVRALISEANIEQLIQAEDAVRQRENQVKATLPNAEAAQRRSEEFGKTADMTAVLKSRRDVAAAVKRAAAANR